MYGNMPTYYIFFNELYVLAYIYYVYLCIFHVLVSCDLLSLV